MVTVPLLVALAFSPPLTIDAPLTRGRWEACLQAFAQVESLGSKTDVTIAISALAACSAERDRYIKVLFREVDQKY
jgi:hypothetical protein